ncbi:MAG: citrate synthase/methylcitrate synthase [Chloroflexota bacterium]|nr:citrate synthase/methylcitrate synthase [Chloroflexota bacterium]
MARLTKPHREAESEMSIPTAVPQKNPADAPHTGLEGVIAARTELSDVDGRAGVLTVRGYDIEELAGNAAFEEVAHLLWHGALPTATELRELQGRLSGYRRLPEETSVAIELAARRMPPMDALQFIVGSLIADDPDPEDESREANLMRAEKLVARVPVIVAGYHRLRSGQSVLEPREDCSLAANFLYQLLGKEQPAGEIRGLDTYLVTVADHGMNASTFAARVIASTASDMYSAVTGALGALKGRLHGGAPGPALQMIEEIGTPDRAEAWMRDAVASGRRLMGFGHRIYKVRDPRAEVLYQAAEALADETGEQQALALAREVERAGVQVLAESKPGRNLNTNVEFYTALLLREIGLPQDLFTPTFAIGRTAGWTAHVLEQQATGRLIRPQSEYIGPRGLRYIPVSQR